MLTDLPHPFLEETEIQITGVDTGVLGDPGMRAALSYLLMLMKTAVFFMFWKNSLLQSPLVAGVKEQDTTMKSDSAAS